MLRRFACLILSMLLLPAASWAEDPVSNARAVISGQINAFRSDDAEAAYAFASPGIRSTFRTEFQFLEMVRKTYPPVYRADSYAFGRAKLVGGGELVFQEVLISGSEGKDWTAIYELRLMGDGAYKVNGVRLRRNTSSTGI